MDINLGELTTKLVELCDAYLLNFSDEAKESICKAFFIEMKRQNGKAERQQRIVEMHITPETDQDLLHHLIFERTRALKRLDWKEQKLELTYSGEILKRINDERKNKMFEYRQTYHYNKKVEKLANRRALPTAEEHKDEPEPEQEPEKERIPTEPKYEQTKKQLKQFRELPMNKKKPEQLQETLNL
jgi:putative protein kinase ArgK-like GTPase of G3E family